MIANRSLPYNIPIETLSMIDRLDAITLLSASSDVGWPSEFAPKERECGRCGSVLGGPRLHSGSKGKSKGLAYLLTRQNPFKTVKIYVRYCQDCNAMHQATTFDIGKI